MYVLREKMVLYVSGQKDMQTFSIGEIWGHIVLRWSPGLVTNAKKQVRESVSTPFRCSEESWDPLCARKQQVRVGADKESWKPEGCWGSDEPPGDPTSFLCPVPLQIDNVLDSSLLAANVQNSTDGISWTPINKWWRGDRTEQAWARKHEKRWIFK